jgi:undecaprenyl pyrophosphate phosphatase UppP
MQLLDALILGRTEELTNFVPGHLILVGYLSHQGLGKFAFYRVILGTFILQLGLR